MKLAKHNQMNKQDSKENKTIESCRCRHCSL